MPPLRRGRVAHAEGDGGEAHEVEPLPLIQVIEEDSKVTDIGMEATGPVHPTAERCSGTQIVDHAVP